MVVSAVMVSMPLVRVKVSYGMRARNFASPGPRITAPFIALPCNGQAETLALQSLRPIPGTKIFMFGYPEPMKWVFDPAAGLKIEIPEPLQAESRRPNEYAWGWTIQTG